MGKSTTPKYRVETWEGFNRTPYPTQRFSWDIKSYGRATEANLTKWANAYNQSFQPGGVNEVKTGTVPYAYKARIVEQKTGQVMVCWNAPSFQVM